MGFFLFSACSNQSVRPDYFGMLQLFFLWMWYSAQMLHLSVFSGLGGAHLVFLFPRESLERKRLKFSLREGKVTALCLQEGEQVWALNIKRALLSMLQTSHMSSKQELEKEVSIDGGYVLFYIYARFVRCIHTPVLKCLLRFQKMTYSCLTNTTSTHTASNNSH